MVVMLLNSKQRKKVLREKKTLVLKIATMRFILIVKISLKMEKKIKIVSDEQKLKKFIAYPHCKKCYKKFSRLKKNETSGNSELQEGIKSTRRGNMW